MPSINLKDLRTKIHLMRAGLVSGLLTKEEVIDWADKIITEDKQPDIFFIDLALSSAKSKNDIIHYFSNYLNFDNPVVVARPLLGLLYKQYKCKQLSLGQTLTALLNLTSETVFTETEERIVRSIENDFELAENNMHGPVTDHARQRLEKFLEIYKEYSSEDLEQWQHLDQQVDAILDAERRKQKERDEKRLARELKNVAPWWKFW